MNITKEILKTTTAKKNAQQRLGVMNTYRVTFSVLCLFQKTFVLKAFNHDHAREKALAMLEDTGLFDALIKHQLTTEVVEEVL